MVVVVTGATGLVGRHLVRALSTRGHVVRALARSPAHATELPPKNVFAWTSDQPVPTEALTGADAVIHLAGENVADGRWTDARKHVLRSSRVETTARLVGALGLLRSGERPRVLVSASAIGYYAPSGDLAATEETAPGGGFLSTLCADWEAEAAKAEELGARVVTPRFGVVLARGGGALAKMGPAVLGNGRQWMSWIHVTDLVNFLIMAITDDGVRGAYNLTSPNPVRNRDFVEAYCRTLRYPLTVTAPAPALKLALGEMASMLLDDSKALPARLLKKGFHFEFPTLAAALGDLFDGESYLDSRFEASQFVPRPRAEIFPFFSHASNLETLTPPWLGFHVDGMSSPDIQEGTLIDYRLRIHGAPVRWRTLISRWNPDSSFVDEQLKGPYQRWHHVHTFEDVPGGTLLRDVVTYRLPGHAIGKSLLNSWIRRDVETIFHFRREKILELFGEGTRRNSR